MATSRKEDKTRHLARADSNEQDASKGLQSRLFGSGAVHEAEKAHTKDGAGGGPAEEWTCTRGRGMRLLKIGESRTRM